ncbi:MAG TPA: hypothetical protein DEH40_11930 [Marinilabiliales bacterium]|nr:hypothetical protein [Marinilabiliales bacterium]
MTRLLKMAWRNCWRNKRRTLITAASIFFAVFFAIIMRSFQLGTYGHMIRQSIEMFSGYLQVQNPEYYDDPHLDHSITYNAQMMDTLTKYPGVKVAVPRVEAFALVSTGNQSKGVMVIGIDPVKETSVSNPEHFIVNYRMTPGKAKLLMQELEFTDKEKELLKMYENSVYNNLERLFDDLTLNDEKRTKYRPNFEKHLFYKSNYLVPDDSGVLISSKLAQFLNVEVGDTLVMIGQGFQGHSAADLFPVRGMVRVPAPDLDNKLIYTSLNKSQSFFNLENRITSIILNLKDPDDMLLVQKELSDLLDSKNYVVKNWQELNPTLKQQIEGDNKSGQMFVGILYFIIFFGIFGTVLMMVSERRREFGVLVAIGMRKRLLIGVVVIEMFFIGFMGTLSGFLAAIPLVVWFRQFPITFTGEMAKMYEDMGFDPIMPTAPVEGYFTWQAVVILIMVLIACYIPLQKIRKMKLMEALRE